MKQYYKDLVRMHGKDKALRIAEACYRLATVSKQNGGIHYADELEAIRKRKNDPKTTRLHKTEQFWRQLVDLIKKH